MTATILLMVSCGVLSAQYTHVLGWSPVLAAVLCAACFLKPRQLWVVGLGGMLVRDLILGLTGFTVVRLLAAAAVVGVVLLLKVRPTLKSLLTALVLASPVYHLVLTVGDWATGTCGLWPRTAQGLGQAIVSTVPYFQRVLVGDLFFTSLFLCLYGLAAYALLGWQAQRS